MTATRTDLIDSEPIPNDSGNPPFSQVAASLLTRRKVLGGGAAALVGFMAKGPLEVSPSAAAAVTGSPTRYAGTRTGTKRLGFEAVPMSSTDAVVVPKGYTATPFIPWGDPIVPGGPGFKGLLNTPDEQAAQFGSGHDGIGYFPLGHGKLGDQHGILCVNHEYTTEEFFHPDGASAAARTSKSQAGHGVSVVEVLHRDGSWSVVADGGYNRRITANTPMAFSGPAAGHPSLRTAADPTGMNPLGTINNCGSGVTPWGTYITCEENFNGNFGSTKGSDFVPTAAQKRYGLVAEGFGYNWHQSDPRFDLSAVGYENEHNRFGWQVEIDPEDPKAKPIKRTALGRFKHEGMAIVIGRGNRAVAYMGDDERFDYLYKFVSDKPYQWYLRRGLSPLDEGILYVAQFHADGRGVWLPLVHGSGPLTVANGFSDQGDVLVRARMAADAVGATPMDRPEWTTVAPDGWCYLTCTNNTRRTISQVDAANPRADNKWGHIVRWYDSYGHVGVNFEWDVVVLAGPGGGVDGSTNDAAAAFGSPDGLWADPDGRLWIQTDGAQPGGANDQMLCADPDTGEIRRFLTGVKGCEVTGVTMTPDQRTMFVNIQHPGDGDPTVSNWPDGGSSLPRPATVIITKDDGGIIGS